MRFSINDSIRKEEDIREFIKWVHYYNNKYVSISYKLWMINNIIESYNLLKGEEIINSRYMTTKEQLNVMWKYINNWYKNKTE
jgi:hypothetical protein